MSVEEQKLGASSFQRGLDDASLTPAFNNEKEVVYCRLTTTYNASSEKKTEVPWASSRYGMSIAGNRQQWSRKPESPEKSTARSSAEGFGMCQARRLTDATAVQG